MCYHERMKARRVVALALGVAFVFGLVQEVRYYRYGVSLVHPVRKHPSAEETARAARLAAEEASFETSDGLRLRGSFVPPKNGVVLVMAHGLHENRMRFLFEAEALAKRGYGALFFDGRGHGESDGTVSTWGRDEQRDVEAAVGFAQAHGAKHVATLGFSIGSTSVLLEAAHDPRVEAVIIEAIWPTLEEEMATKLGGRGWLSRVPAELALKRAGWDYAQVRPIDHLAELGGRPKLFIGGTEDTDTPPVIVRRVYEAAPQPKQLWIVPGAEHGGYARVAPAEYERVLIAFLDGVFFT